VKFDFLLFNVYCEVASTVHNMFHALCLKYSPSKLIVLLYSVVMVPNANTSVVMLNTNRTVSL